MSYLSESDYTKRCKVTGLNNAEDLDLDQDVMEDLDGHGICIGITGGWIIGLLCGADGAKRTSKFETYFKTLLRPQGAYIKFAHDIKPGERIGRLMGLLGVNNVRRESEKKNLDSFRGGVFPSSDRSWAAHLSIHHHDIGCGHLKGTSEYFIMDPNHGLYVYPTREAMLNVLEDYRAERKKKRGGEHAGCTAWIYGLT